MIANPLTLLIATLALAPLLPLASSLTAAESMPAQGPLRIHPNNPRYFTDGTKLPDGSLKAVYLTGSHHWHNLQDAGRIGGPVTKVFDYDGYLDFLAKYNHNFIRLWAWEGAAWWYQGGQNDEYYVPLAYARTGPGNALDGKPKFDLEQFNPEYFDRLRSRVIAARDRGFYVGVMLFQGWSVYNHDYGNPWPLHPFNQAEMEGARMAMGQTRRFAERMNLAAMIPRNDLASTRYCLADPGGEYLVYQPRSGAQFSVALAPGSYEVEWFSPADGKTARGESIKTPGGAQHFRAPFEHDAVLYLNRTD